MPEKHPTTPLLDTLSPAAQKLDLLCQLFPQAVQIDPDGSVRVDAAQIQRALDPSNAQGIRVEETGYELRWVGKQEAYHTAFARTGKIATPAPDDSKNWDTTANLLIKGDNLDALKLLRQSYFGQVKLIYIDPPYNTKSDEFIYCDDFTARQTDILAQLGYSADNIEYIQNIYGARTHSGWLSFMYPRLLLAKDLLRDDGVIFISIDDNEQAQLKLLCDEVFGQDNFITSLTWEKGRKNDAKLFSNGHEYMLVYGKSVDHLKSEQTIWREEKPGARAIWEQYLSLRKVHGDNDSSIEKALQEWYAELPKGHPSKKWSRYKRIDKNGPWRDRDISWPGGGGPRYDVLHPVTGIACKVPERGWIYSDPSEMQRQISINLVEFRTDHTEPPFRKAHLKPIAQELVTDSEDDADDEELATQVRGTYLYKQSQVSVKHLRTLFGKKVFNNPKDMEEIGKLIQYASSGDASALVLDFFAGSGTTGEAVMRLNAEDGGQRQFILVQIPQLIDPKKQKEAHDFVKQTLDKPEATIFEITAERLRRAGDKINAEQRKQGKPAVDVGFRVYALADDPHALVHRTRLDEATQADVAALQTAIATPQPEQRPVVLANLLLTEGLPLSATLEQLSAGGVFDALWQAQDTLFVLDSVPLDALTDLLRQRKEAGTPVHHVSVYAPWVHDDNFLQGVQTLLDAEGFSPERLRLRG